MNWRRGAWPVLLLALVVFVLIATFNSDWWLSRLGAFLVRAESPVRSDAILVLAGDPRGNRIMKACELLQKGYAPVALVSGPGELTVYGFNEAELAIRFAQARNCPPDKLVAVKVKALSTNDEAREFGEYFRQNGIRRVLLVTSNYHTARSWKEFHNVLGPEVQLRTIAAKDPYYHAEDWWKTREGRKIWFMEATKIVAAAIGL